MEEVFLLNFLEFINVGELITKFKYPIQTTIARKILYHHNIFQVIVVTMFIQSYVHDPITVSRNEETFVHHFSEILKRMLRNFYKNVQKRL